MNLDDHESTGLLHAPTKLRARFGETGFLFFRGLLEPVEVGRVRAQVLERLHRVGWLRPGCDLALALPGPRVHHDRGTIEGRPASDPEWSTGYAAVQSLESLHRLAHSSALLEVLQHLLSGDVVVHPRKIARMSFPGLRFPTPPHQDALFNQVATDVLTAWVPLGDCRASSGGLRVLAGSAAWGVLKARADEGLGGESVDVPLDDPRWVEGDYRCGDVILFHSRTVHMAPANRGQSLRLSVDFRYQSTLEPVTAAMLSPHGHAAGQLPGWRELTEGWSSVKWVETGHPVRVVAVAPPSLPPSRLIHARLRDGAGSGATG